MQAQTPTQVPIIERLTRLREQWIDFADDPEARVLCWAIAPGDERMVETFFDVESDEVGETPDLFVRLDVPFDGPRGHGQRLVRTLTGFYHTLSEELDEAGVDTSWVPPSVSDGDPEGASVLAVTATSFWRHHQPLFRRLALVLQPTNGAGDPAWPGWLAHAARFIGTENVRLVTVDTTSPPGLAAAAETNPALHVVDPDLRMGAALEEVSEAAGGQDTPQGQFRHLFVQMSNALAAGDLDEAESLGASAILIAQEHDWLHLLVAVYFSLGGGWLTKGDVQRSIRRYKQAEAAAVEMIANEEESGRTLQVKVRLAAGGVYLTAEMYHDAAALYAGTAPIAQADDDRLMALESCRMAAYAYECAKAWDEAWDAGLRALGIGEAMDDEERAHSTLPFVGEGLLRVTNTYRYAPHAGTIHRRMSTLLGPDWRAQTQAQNAPVEPEETHP